MKTPFLVLSALSVLTVVGCKKDPCGDSPHATTPSDGWAKIGFPEGATMCQESYQSSAMAVFPSPAEGDRVVDALLTSKGYKKLPRSKKRAKDEFDAAVGGRSKEVNELYAKEGDPIRIYTSSSHAIADRGWISAWTADCSEYPTKKVGPAEWCDDE